MRLARRRFFESLPRGEIGSALGAGVFLLPFERC
jgi:hypothetical protein